MKRWWLRLVPFSLPQWRGIGVLLLLMLAGVALDLLKPWPLTLIA